MKSIIAAAAIACFLIGVAVLLTHVALAPRQIDLAKIIAAKDQLVIDQHASGGGAYVVLRDSKTKQCLEIIADRWLPHVAFYESYNTGDYPVLAISRQGLQLKTSDGKLRFIDIDELESLDKGKPWNPKKAIAGQQLAETKTHSCACGNLCQCEGACLCSIKATKAKP